MVGGCVERRVCIFWVPSCVTRCWARTLLSVDGGRVPRRVQLASWVVSQHSPHDLRAGCDGTIGPWDTRLFEETIELKMKTD